MKKILYLFLGLFLLVDVFLAIRLFIPELIQSTRTDRISLSSAIATVHPKLANIKYLQKKLEERTFWKPLKVNLYKKGVTKVTVRNIHFILTDEPQPIIIQSRKIKNINKVEMSYSQKFDTSSQTMTIYLHGDQTLNKEYSPEYIYTGLVLYSIFDLTYSYPRSMSEFTEELKEFQKEFYQNPDKLSLVELGFL